MSSRTKHWRAIGALLAGVVALAVMLSERGDDERPMNGALPAAMAPSADARHPAAEGSRATRRIFDGCQPAEAARAYERFVGGRALATLSWNGMPERAAELRIPLYVEAVRNAAVHVRFLQFPIREQYMLIWIESGHIRPGPGDLFLLDPCSATIAPWPTAPHGDAANEAPSG